jgi:hypothetical protein
LPWYSWNIAESGIKHNKSNQINLTGDRRISKVASTMKAYWDIPLSDKPFITNTYYGIDKKSPVGGKYS